METTETIVTGPEASSILDGVERAEIREFAATVLTTIIAGCWQHGMKAQVWGPPPELNPTNPAEWLHSTWLDSWRRLQDSEGSDWKIAKLASATIVLFRQNMDGLDFQDVVIHVLDLENMRAFFQAFAGGAGVPDVSDSPAHL
jgi:hypothetical protein